ncbi:pheromone autoinducer 2 transporter [Budvicia aquatica]|uniref:Pheromone autoinducer 2 transporter n=1 Tax=Budvicia aquatica TaxID=82979 RepID=A0A484ZIQ9_9GAMM|nr:pheromone autoinducer 2 transporter [Budvicia aquatica]
MDRCEIRHAVGRSGLMLNYIPNIGSFIAAVPPILQACYLTVFADGLAVLAAILPSTL